MLMRNSKRRKEGRKGESREERIPCVFPLMMGMICIFLSTPRTLDGSVPRLGAVSALQGPSWWAEFFLVMITCSGRSINCHTCAEKRFFFSLPPLKFSAKSADASKKREITTNDTLCALYISFIFCLIHHCFFFFFGLLSFEFSAQFLARGRANSTSLRCNQGTQEEENQ